MPFQVPGFPGTFYEPGERRGYHFLIWRGLDPNGKRIEYRTGETTRSGAQGFVRRLLESLHRDRPPPAGSRVTLAEAIMHYSASINPTKADQQRLARIEALHGSLIVADINQSHVTAAAMTLRGVRTETRNREVVTPYRAVLHFAEGQRWCPYMRIKSIRAPSGEPPVPVQRVAADDAVATLMGGATPPQRALLRLVHERGYRIGEWLRLDWSNLNLQAGTGSVLIKKPRPRWVDFDLSPEAVADLAALDPKPTGRVFTWGTRQNVYRWLKRLEERTGVYWRPHESRRAVVSDIVRETGDFRLAQAYVGHGNVKTTMRYRIIGASEATPAVRWGKKKNWGT